MIYLPKEAMSDTPKPRLKQGVSGIKPTYNLDCTPAGTVCPRCKTKEFWTRRAALSRRDNETLICSDCGTAEAFEDYLNVMYQDKPYWKVGGGA
jgi:uncharacterized protein YbaR (Trm112 family)